MQEGVGHLGPWEQVRGQILLGQDAFITRLQPAPQQSHAIPEVSKVNALRIGHG